MPKHNRPAPLIPGFRVVLTGALLLAAAPVVAVMSCGIEVPDTTCHKVGAYTAYEICNNIMVSDLSCPTVRPAYQGETGHNGIWSQWIGCSWWEYTPNGEGGCTWVPPLRSRLALCEYVTWDEAHQCNGSGNPPEN